MQGKLLKCTETMSWLCNGLAGMIHRAVSRMCTAEIFSHASEQC